MWYVIVVNCTSVRLVYLTSSKKKCIQKYNELKNEEYNLFNMHEEHEISIYYYGFYEK